MRRQISATMRPGGAMREHGHTSAVAPSCNSSQRTTWTPSHRHDTELQAEGFQRSNPESYLRTSGTPAFVMPSFKPLHCIRRQTGRIEFVTCSRRDFIQWRRLHLGTWAYDALRMKTRTGSLVLKLVCQEEARSRFQLRPHRLN